MVSMAFLGFSVVSMVFLGFFLWVFPYEGRSQMRISKLRKGMLILASAIVKRCIAIDRRLVRDCKNAYARLLSLNLVVTTFCMHAYSVIKMISQRHQG